MKDQSFQEVLQIILPSLNSFNDMLGEEEKESLYKLFREHVSFEEFVKHFLNNAPTSSVLEFLAQVPELVSEVELESWSSMIDEMQSASAHLNLILFLYQIAGINAFQLYKNRQAKPTTEIIKTLGWLYDNPSLLTLSTDVEDKEEDDPQFDRASIRLEPDEPSLTLEEGRFLPLREFFAQQGAPEAERQDLGIVRKHIAALLHYWQAPNK